MQIRVLGVPQTGAKSRVETQIKLCIQLVTDDGDKAQWWSHIKLPEHMVAKDKLKRQVTMTTSPNGQPRVASITDNNNNPIRPDKMLFLSARVICASDPKRKVVTCLGCIQREVNYYHLHHSTSILIQTFIYSVNDLNDVKRIVSRQRMINKMRSEVLPWMTRNPWHSRSKKCCYSIVPKWLISALEILFCLLVSLAIVVIIMKRLAFGKYTKSMFMI